MLEAGCRLDQVRRWFMQRGGCGDGWQERMMSERGEWGGVSASYFGDKTGGCRDKRGLKRLRRLWHVAQQWGSSRELVRLKR